MQYLNNRITTPIPSNFNSYIPYSVGVQEMKWTPDSNYTTIYNGRLYSYSSDQKLYLNDILSSYSDLGRYMSYDSIREHNSNKSYNSLAYITQKPEIRSYVNTKITFPTTSTTIESALWFQDKNSIKPSITSSNWFSSSSVMGVNLLSQRTTLLPRIPALNVYKTDFFVGGLVATSYGWSRFGKKPDSTTGFRIVVVDENGRLVPNPFQEDIYNETSSIPTPVTSIIFNGYIIDGQSPQYYDIELLRGYYFAIAPTYYIDGVYREDIVAYPIPLAQIDYCNADYYLIWVDRTGGYQCQPFHKKTIREEDIKTTLITNLYEEKRSLVKEVNDKWVVNSDWLTFEEYKAYESIFTSPYIYLFDTKYNELNPVVCEMNKWTSKERNNTTKPFNLQLTLSYYTSQKIIY